MKMPPKNKASVLIVSLIILSIILIIALSVALNAIRQRSASIESADSSQSFQMADSGIEDILYEISKMNPFDDLAGSTFAYCTIGGANNGLIVKTGEYSVELKTEDGERIDCYDNSYQVIDIFSLKVSGLGLGVGRVIQAPVLRPDPVSCLAILDNDPSATDGVYEINPTGDEPFKVYCDMTTDGGGWTLVARVKDDSYAHKDRAAINWVSDTPILPDQTGVAKLDDNAINSLRVDYSSSTSIIRMKCSSATVFFNQNKEFNAKDGGATCISRASIKFDGAYTTCAPSASNQSGLSTATNCLAQNTIYAYGQDPPQLGCYGDGNNKSGTMWVRAEAE